MWRIFTMRAAHHKPLAGTAGEDGVVLVLVLLILALISVMVLSWAQEWRTELKLASNYGKAHQCQRLAEAGIYYALGKMVVAKRAELQGQAIASQAAEADFWEGDQQPHRLELPDGLVEVKIADEAGKINLNLASEELLRRFFTVLGLSELQVRTMVDSILDWRSRGDYPRPYGAKSAYYLSLDPPYAAKAGKFETVEELAWVHGFEASPWIARLSQWLTIQTTSPSINLNTAPLEVLLAVGLPQDAAVSLIATRQTAPLRSLQETPQLSANPLLGQFQQFSFRSSSFFTITSTGMVNKHEGAYTIKAIVRLEVNRKVPWSILSWYDGYPG
jgi:general secretion pathway protein K